MPMGYQVLYYNITLEWGAMIPHESLGGCGRLAYPLSSFSFVYSRFVTVLQIFVTFGKLFLGTLDITGESFLWPPYNHLNPKPKITFVLPTTFKRALYLEYPPRYISAVIRLRHHELLQNGNNTHENTTKKRKYFRCKTNDCKIVDKK